MKSIEWFRTCLMRIGIAYDLKTHVVHEGPQPDDMLEEYDSPETISALAGALRALGCDTIELGGGRGFLERMLAAPGCVDLVFNIAEGQRSRSREAHVPAVCEMLGVPYTHSDPLTLAMTLDKELTKRIAASHGIATAPFCLIERTSDVADAPIPPFPIIAKPNGEGSSMGIRRNAVCRDRAALACRVEALLANYRQPVLVESFLPGTEVTVAVMGDGPGAHALGAMEIAPRDGGAEHFIYGVETKRNYLAEVDYHVPPRLLPRPLAQSRRWRSSSTGFWVAATLPASICASIARENHACLKSTRCPDSIRRAATCRYCAACWVSPIKT